MAAAVAMVLGAMSAGNNWFAQKKLADLVEQQGAPYTPSRGQRSTRHSADNPPAAVASASTERPQRPVLRVPVAVAATIASQAPAPGTPWVPSNSGVNPGSSSAISGAAQSIVSPLLPSPTPPANPSSATPDSNIQPLHPLKQLLQPVTSVLPLEAQIKTPALEIYLRL
jgi:hypothetical protein